MRNLAPGLRTQRLRVAFVVQRYGEEVNGGAEALCRMVAERMARHWEVEVLTTCALDYITWRDHYPPGVDALNGVTVRRFPVPEPRDLDRFNRLSEALRANPQPSIEEQEAWMRAQGPWSPRLFEWIELQSAEYDLFIFFGYLYAQSYFGLSLTAGRAVLAPFAHDEWTIHLGMWDAAFHRPVACIFSAVEEKRFLERRFPDANLRGPIVGVTVERPAGVAPARFRSAYGIEEDFLLYVGRIDLSKGCGEMFDFFIEHARITGDRRPLVALGRSAMEIPRHSQIRPLGFVTEEVKWDALAACDMLLMPSPYESLSLVLLEAWSVGKPVLVNGASDVLLGQIRRANGGLAYRSRDEFSACIHALSAGGAPGALGRQGRDFVRSAYSWDSVEGEYLRLASAIVSPNSSLRQSASAP